MTRSNGMRFTGADGIDFIGTDGLRFTGADGFINTYVNGLRFTGADGDPLINPNGVRFTGADGLTYITANGARFTGADGIDFMRADALRFTGADGLRFTGADGTVYSANSILVRQPNGISIANPAGVLLTGADALRFTGADGTATFADALRFTGADAIRFTGADSIIGFDNNGNVLFSIPAPFAGMLTGPDGMRFTGADAIFSLIEEARFTGADGLELLGLNNLLPAVYNGLQSIDPDLAVFVNNLTDDTGVNAVVTFHQYPTESDLNRLRQIGILGGTKFRVLPMIYVIATRHQLEQISQMPNVRSVYGNRTIRFDSDPYFKPTGVGRVSADQDLKNVNGGLPVNGKNVTVAVLDTGVNGLHNDLAGRVVQNVKLLDLQGVPLGFLPPIPLENLPTTDLLGGHGTFVAGVIAGSGASSNRKYDGVAPGAKIMGLSAGDLNLSFVLSGLDYILLKGQQHNVRVVNCSFSTDAVFDMNDPVNIATKMLTDRGVNVVFSAGNTGPGNATLNPYSVAPWVISVGATDHKGTLASFSSRGVFGDPMFQPSLVAPGVNIVSTRSLGLQAGILGLLGADLQRLTLAEIPFYTTASGTSFSAPQVSGAIALMLDANPNLTPAQVKDILQRSASPMPNYFAHEVGAGMLNTYAAVLEASNPNRRTGTFRPALTSDSTEYVTQSQVRSAQTNSNSASSISNAVPANAVQSNFFIAWNRNGIGNLGLKVLDGSGNLLARSERTNLLGLFGKNEKVNIARPTSSNLIAQVGASSGSAPMQSYLIATETTKADIVALTDIGPLSTADRNNINEGLRRFLLPVNGNRYFPNASFTRAEFAAALVRTGKVPQFVDLQPMYSDVRDLTTRNAVEAAQNFESGKLFYDVNANFRPDQSVSRLVYAVAMVKAAGLEGQVSSSFLPLLMGDTGQIPAQYRGYAAIALQKGWLTLNSNKFEPNRNVTRNELARGIVGLSK